MKKIEEIYELLEGIIPNKAKKTVMYCEVEKTAYEIFYYSFFEDGSSKHSADLIDSGELNSLAVEKGFEKIADFVRDTDFFDEEKRNLITLIVEGTSEYMEKQQYDKTVGLYKIKKDWKQLHGLK